MHLFYHDDRWVAEEELGKHGSHGWIRYEGLYICPEQITTTPWKFYDVDADATSESSSILIKPAEFGKS